MERNDWIGGYLDCEFAGTSNRSMLLGWRETMAMLWAYREVMCGRQMRVSGAAVLVEVDVPALCLMLDCDERDLETVFALLERSGMVRMHAIQGDPIALCEIRDLLVIDGQVRRRSDIVPERPRELQVSGRMAKLITRFKARCVYCDRLGTEARDPDGHFWTRDHIVPVIAGGSNRLDNLALACRRCNSTKGDRPAAYLQARLDELAAEKSRL